MNFQFRKELNNLGTRMKDMKAKVSSLDAQRSPVKSFATTGKNVASTRDPDDSDGELILPMIDSFKKSRSIHEQVNARINQLGKRKCESEIRGTETVFVKKEVLWPQNFILLVTLKVGSAVVNCSKASGFLGFPLSSKINKI